MPSGDLRSRAGSISRFGAADGIIGELLCQGGTLHEIEQQIVLFLTNVLQTIGWPGVVVIMALESANIPIPSEVTMPLAGWMLVQARGFTALQAFLFGGFFGALGCTIGSAASYWLGAWGEEAADPTLRALDHGERGRPGESGSMVRTLGRLGGVTFRACYRSCGRSSHFRPA